MKHEQKDISRLALIIFILIAISVMAGCSAEPFELRLKGVKKATSALDIITAWNLTSGTPVVESLSPKEGSIFILIDLQIINLSPEMIEVEGDKLKGKTTKGVPIDLLPERYVSEDHKAFLGKMGVSYSFRIPPNDTILRKLLAVVRKDEEGIIIRYGRGERLNINLSEK